MEAGNVNSLSVANLRERFIRIAPEVVFVSPRILRRVIKKTRSLRGALAQVPHREGFNVSKADLLRYVTWRELGAAGRSLPDEVILLERPTTDALASMSAEQALLRWWRLLYHQRIHAALEGESATRRFAQAEIRERIASLGQTAFDAVRAVLDEEDLLLPPRNALREWVEFVALFSSLYHFAPHFLPRYFPECDDPERWFNIIQEDLDTREILKATRPEDAPEPRTERVETLMRPVKAKRKRRRKKRPLKTGPYRVRRLARVAHRAAKATNHVRAALALQRAAAPTAEALAQTIDPEAADQVGLLVRRLKSALGLDAPKAKAWQGLLESLLPAAATGLRDAGARILYDLQKVCVDHERGVHTVDLVGFLLSFGRRPLKRKLPVQREVLMCRHLRAVQKRVHAVNLPREDRKQLKQLVDHATAAADDRARKKCRPKLEEALDELAPSTLSLPEKVSEQKLVDELLDRIVERGYLNLGELRDALARSSRKLDDCHGIGPLSNVSGLLTADRDLSKTLDGVYSRGEIYLRILQRGSGAAFGTKVGRFLTKYLVIPFLGAFVLLEGMSHLISPISGLLGGPPIHLVDSAYLSVIVIGLAILGIMHVTAVRKWAWSLVKRFGRWARQAVWDLPIALLKSEVVQGILRSHVARFLVRFVFRPALPAVLVALPWMFLGAEVSFFWRVFGLSFLGFNLFLNTQPGRAAEEIGTDWLNRAITGFRLTIIVGVVRFVLWFFRALLAGFEQLLYFVDEWLRFKSGETQFTLVFKALLGVIWGATTWLMRIFVNLLLEPQVNPVKHFPVVTVSHKLMLGGLDIMTREGSALLEPFMGKALAVAVTVSFATLLPGFFGFLVWELKENWRLFASNRSPWLRPVVVGSHGETVLRLMRPGFHSGTLPKAYGRLRKVEQKSLWTGERASARRLKEIIHHVEVSIERWVERDLIALLNASPEFPHIGLQVKSTHAAANLIHIDIECSEGVASNEPALQLAFEEQSQLLLADIRSMGFLASLPAKQSRCFRNALIGLFKSGGVHIVRQDLERRMGYEGAPYDVTDQGLVVWPGPGFETEVPMDLADFEFTDHPVPWSAWEAAWEDDSVWRLLPEVSVLREEDHSPEAAQSSADSP